MNLSFKNRIAFHYMIATAIIMALVFGFVYFMVRETVFRHLDHDLSFEAEKHTTEIKVTGDSIMFANKAEWEEREHREIQVNPVFIQLIDNEGRLMDKSPNLKDNVLPFREEKFGGHFDARLNGKAIRQVQLPIEENGKIRGYILSAISSEAEESVIMRLRNVLLLSYLFVLIGLYYVSRFLAGRSIIPVKEMTRTIQRIRKNNLNERVALPRNKDEIYELSAGFNALLERIESAMERERQFTSDASHELRTPLAALRGTLEVLLRKKRSPEEYEEKIKCSLSEINRMSDTIEQLLLLARLDNGKSDQKDSKVSIATLIDDILSRRKAEIAEKKLKIFLDINENGSYSVPHYHAHLILDNLISNAIKYSYERSPLHLRISMENEKIRCEIEDRGIGIREEDQSRVFNHFFRSEALEHKDIPGNGLGLSIVKKSAEAIGAEIEVKSVPGKGSTFSVLFLSKS